MFASEKIRNLAIVAHIDHGKTTLIDSIFRATQVFRDNSQMKERVMDNHELERERGITIRSKHCTVEWNDYLINIIDTPGHADFSGEVERVLSMVDAVLLLVDANEGPMPQTRYVLRRALELGLRVIVVVNKVDRPQAEPARALDLTFDLFIELGANDEQTDFPVLYGSGLDGWLVRDMADEPHQGLDPLFEAITEEVKPPNDNGESEFLMQVSTLAWNDYIGRIGCGRVLQGKHKVGDQLNLTSTRWNVPGSKEDGWEIVSEKTERSSHLWVTRGLERVDVEEVSAGDIIWLAGPKELYIGDTLADTSLVDSVLQPLVIEEPTVSVFFLVNSGPFAGDEGKAVTLRQIKERLQREIRTNVALRMEDLGRADGVKVYGRGSLHLAILIEEMRREGIELCVSRPEVITILDKNGKVNEPMEQLVIDVPDEYQGAVIEKISARKGELTGIENTGNGLVRLQFKIPTRGLIGYREEFLTDTRGLGIMSSLFIGYDIWRGEISVRNRGALVSLDTGVVTNYAMENLQKRGRLFVRPFDQVYNGMIVGESSRQKDINCNPTKKKHLTNHRSSNRDIVSALDVPRSFTIDTALEWLADGELVEVTPKSIRLRKTILDPHGRKQLDKRAEAMAG
jgi:GTP-binding protein